MKLLSCILGIIASTFLMIVGVILFAGGLAEKITSMYIVGLILLLASLYFIITLSKKNAQIKKAKVSTNCVSTSNQTQRKTYKEQVLLNKEKRYRKIKYKFSHVTGLPLMEGAICKLVSTPDKIIINGQGTTFELNKDKITSITIEKNITQFTQAVSSAGGALAGAMAFGVVGAAIGGRTTTKNVKSTKYYIVITYFDSKENVKYIVFDNNIKGTTLVDDFNTFNKNKVVSKVVELD